MHEKSWAKRPVLESNKHSHFRRSICLSRQEQTTHFMMQIPANLISSSDMERPSTGSYTGATTLQLRTLYAVPGSGAIFLSGVTQLCHLPTGPCTAPTLISAGSQLGIGASAYLITGNGALVAHLSANIADGCGDGGTAQHEIFAELAELGAVLSEPQMIGRYVGTTLLDSILDRLDTDHMTLFTIITSPLNNWIRCL